MLFPIYKNGNKLDCNNYRPISPLSNISKIYENGYSVNHALTSF